MIVSFGTLCLDRVHLVPHMPRYGGYVEATEVRPTLGGEAVNTALTLRALGVESRLQSNPIGRDEAGEAVLKLMEDHRLDPPLIIDGYTTPVTDIFVTPDGERTMVGAGFAAMDQYDSVLPDVREASWLTAEPNMPNASRRAVEHAQSAGIKSYLMDFYDPEHDAIVSRCDVWQSSTDWVGERGDTEENLRWVEEHARRFGCATIVTDGPRGLFAASEEFGVRAFPALKAPAVVDTTGAGDVFRAGVLAALADEKPFTRALLFGAVAAACAIGTLGATNGLPDRERVDAVMQQNGLLVRAYD
jgi:ribokinase